MSSKSTAKDNTSDELKSLLLHQQQIKLWLMEVESRIAELEEQYLDETQFGNIVRGWEIDGRPPIIRSRGVEDKEKIFSNSSYQHWKTKAAVEFEPQEKKLKSDSSLNSNSKSSSGHNNHGHHGHHGHHGSHKSKKHKKSSSSIASPSAQLPSVSQPLRSSISTDNLFPDGMDWEGVLDEI